MPICFRGQGTGWAALRARAALLQLHPERDRRQPTGHPPSGREAAVGDIRNHPARLPGGRPGEGLPRGSPAPSGQGMPRRRGNPRKAHREQRRYPYFAWSTSSRSRQTTPFARPWCGRLGPGRSGHEFGPPRPRPGAGARPGRHRTSRRFPARARGRGTRSGMREGESSGRGFVPQRAAGGLPPCRSCVPIRPVGCARGSGGRWFHPPEAAALRADDPPAGRRPEDIAPPCTTGAGRSRAGALRQ